MSEEAKALLPSFENAINQVAVDITSGILIERLQPQELWRRAEKRIATLSSVGANLKEMALTLKPEVAPTIERHHGTMMQRLNTFRDILFQKTTEPLINSRLALEQLRLALVEASDFLVLVKDAQNNPSPAIKEISLLKNKTTAIQTLAELETKVGELTKSIHDLERVKAELEQKVETIKMERDASAQEARKLEEKAVGLQTEIESLRKEKSAWMEKATERTFTKLDEMVNALRGQIVALREDNERLRRQLQDLRK